MLLIIFLQTLFLGSVWSKTCEDGKDNIVEVFDMLKDDGKLRFYDAKILVYDHEKKPACADDGSASVHLPGYLKFHTGKAEVVQPFETKDGKLRIQFTLEHNSFFIGQVCHNGKSTNMFVPETLCEKDFCKIVGDEMCDRLTKKHSVPVNELYSDYFKLPASKIPGIDGQWKIELALLSGGEEVSRLQVSDGWFNVAMKDVKEHEEL